MSHYRTLVVWFWFHSILQLLKFCICIAGNKTGPINVEIASFGLSYGETMGCLPFSGPAQDIALEVVNREYRDVFNFSITYVYDPRIKTCAALQDNAADLVARWYFRDRRTDSVTGALIDPGLIKITISTFPIHEPIEHLSSLKVCKLLVEVCVERPRGKFENFHLLSILTNKGRVTKRKPELIIKIMETTFSLNILSECLILGCTDPESYAVNQLAASFNVLMITR